MDRLPRPGIIPNTITLEGFLFALKQVIFFNPHEENYEFIVGQMI
jgi:hypothetical protein